MARSQPTRQKDTGKAAAAPDQQAAQVGAARSPDAVPKASSTPLRTGAGKTKKKREPKASSAKRSSTRTTADAIEGIRSPKSEAELTRSMIASAVRVAKDVDARAVLLYVDAITETQDLRKILDEIGTLILVARGDKGLDRAREITPHVLSVPPVNLTRMGQIKMATLMAFSQRMLAPGETFVCLVGVMDRGVDTMVVMSVGEEHEMFRTVDQPKITEHIRRAVFQRCLSLAIEIAGEGREGKPVGALFVVGDQDEVAKYCHQTIINPFRGYAEEERNILDDTMRETVKEFCSIDGAFIISGKGVIISAGTTLRTAVSGEELPQGLGARHAAAAAITASTKSIAISLSESTGTVRVWRLGEMITEIEKASPMPARSVSLPIAKDSKDKE
ncbi:MAG: diadenylate cyclase [Phycisphaerae bacterium]|nr:diadenylate cyclase [Phycisphaerae bacterium]